MIDWTEVPTPELLRELAAVVEETRERVRNIGLDPSITAEGFASVIEQSAQALVAGGDDELAADLRAQGLALILQADAESRRSDPPTGVSS